MNLGKFFKQYPNEQSCIEGFKAKRLEMGLICKKFQNTTHYFRKTDLKFEFKKCGTRLSLRSGTVLENNKMPFQYWMICVELMILSKKNLSALEMQHMRGHKRYEPIWLMMDKIRRVMSKRDEKYKLTGCKNLLEMNCQINSMIFEKHFVVDAPPKSTFPPNTKFHKNHFFISRILLLFS